MKKLILPALAALLFAFQTLNAVPAYPGRIVYTQPDGTKIALRLHGDEFAHWATDVSGRVVRQDTDGFFRPVSDEEAARLREGASARRAAARSMRAAARAAKNWAESDRLRAAIAALGWEVRDSKTGQTLRPLAKG